jgi:hypothetical protein
LPVPAAGAYVRWLAVWQALNQGHWQPRHTAVEQPEEPGPAT